MSGETTSAGVIRITHVSLGVAFAIAAATLLALWQVRGLTLIVSFLSAIITFFFSAIIIGTALSILSPVLIKTDAGDR